jgi:hypothetical protein
MLAHDWPLLQKKPAEAGYFLRRATPEPCLASRCRAGTITLRRSRQARPQWFRHWSRYQWWPYRLTDPSQPRARSYWRTSRRALPQPPPPLSRRWSTIRMPGKPILMRVFVSQQTPFCVIDGSARVLAGERRTPVRPSTCRPQRIATNMPSIGVRAIKRLGKPEGSVLAGDGARDGLLHQGGAKPSPQSAVSAGA